MLAGFSLQAYVIWRLWDCAAKVLGKALGQVLQVVRDINPVVKMVPAPPSLVSEMFAPVRDLTSGHHKEHLIRVTISSLHQEHVHSCALAASNYTFIR
jgi:hypothetical protein